MTHAPRLSLRPARRAPDLAGGMLCCGILAGGILAGGILAGATAVPAAADPVQDYLAARDRYVAEIQKLDADPAKQDAMFALDEKARADLKTRMVALLGPLTFKGLEKTPRFSPEALYEGDLGSGQPDGLVFADKKDETRIFISPEPVFANWLAREAKTEGSDPRLRDGVKAAMSSDSILYQTVGLDAAFTTFMALPVTAKDGETVSAALGLFSQDGEADYPPNSITVSRLAGGTLMVAAMPVSEPRKTIAACSQPYKRQVAKADQLLVPAQKGKQPDEAKIEQSMQLRSEAVTAFRTCFAQEAPKQAFYGPLLARVDALLEKMRGK